MNSTPPSLCMERPSQANRSALLDALGRVRDKVDEEGAHFARVEGEHAEAGGYVAKTREVRRVQKREKREADQRLALERAAAAAAASSRVGAQRRDAAGNVIAPAMGALDGLPPDVAAAALEIAAADAKAAELKERERKALAAMPKPQRGYDAAAAAAFRIPRPRPARAPQRPAPGDVTPPPGEARRTCRWTPSTPRRRSAALAGRATAPCARAPRTRRSRAARCLLYTSPSPRD